MPRAPLSKHIELASSSAKTIAIGLPTTQNKRLTPLAMTDRVAVIP
jgi:hypothetical protein